MKNFIKLIAIALLFWNANCYGQSLFGFAFDQHIAKIKADWQSPAWVKEGMIGPHMDVNVEDSIRTICELVYEHGQNETAREKIEKAGEDFISRGIKLTKANNNYYMLNHLLPALFEAIKNKNNVLDVFGSVKQGFLGIRGNDFDDALSDIRIYFRDLKLEDFIRTLLEAKSADEDKIKEIFTDGDTDLSKKAQYISQHITNFGKSCIEEIFDNNGMSIIDNSKYTKENKINFVKSFAKDALKNLFDPYTLLRILFTKCNDDKSFYELSIQDDEELKKEFKKNLFLFMCWDTIDSYNFERLKASLDGEPTEKVFSPRFMPRYIQSLQASQSIQFAMHALMACDSFRNIISSDNKNDTIFKLLQDFCSKYDQYLNPKDYDLDKEFLKLSTLLYFDEIIKEIEQKRIFAGWQNSANTKKENAINQLFSTIIEELNKTETIPSIVALDNPKAKFKEIINKQKESFLEQSSDLQEYEADYYIQSLNISSYLTEENISSEFLEKVVNGIKSEAIKFISLSTDNVKEDLQAAVNEGQDSKLLIFYLDKRPEGVSSYPETLSSDNGKNFNLKAFIQDSNDHSIINVLCGDQWYSPQSLKKGYFITYLNILTNKIDAQTACKTIRLFNPHHILFYELAE